MIQKEWISEYLRLMEEARPKNRKFIYYMVLWMLNSIKCKLIYIDGKQIHAYIGQCTGSGWKDRRINYKGHEKNVRSDVWFHYLIYGNCFIEVHKSKHHFVP